MDEVAPPGPIGPGWSRRRRSPPGQSMYPLLWGAWSILRAARWAELVFGAATSVAAAGGDDEGPAGPSGLASQPATTASKPSTAHRIVRRGIGISVGVGSGTRDVRTRRR